MKSRILVVEDEKNIREGLEELLSLSNFEVQTAADCNEALNYINHTIPHVILCDVVMPTCTGYSLLQQLQLDDRHKNIPFIFLSARAELEQIRYGMNLGADDYITKPFDVDQLLTAINVRLNKREQLAESQMQEADPEKSVRKKELEGLLANISKSEWRVLELLSNNFSSPEISEKLFLSNKTVQNHRANMVKKLGMEGQNTLLSFAVECKIMGLF